MKKLPPILNTLTLGAALVLVFASLVFTGPISNASAQEGAGNHTRQRGQRMRGRRGQRMRRLANELNLSEDQRGRMRVLRQEGMTRARELRRAGDRAALVVHRRSMRDRMRAVLTDAQRAQVQELHGRRQRARLDRRMTNLTERLSLDPTQAQQVRGVLGHANAQRRAIREQARLDQTPPRASMHALREQTRAQLASILSAEQMEQLRAQRRQPIGRPPGR